MYEEKYLGQTVIRSKRRRRTIRKINLKKDQFHYNSCPNHCSVTLPTICVTLSTPLNNFFFISSFQGFEYGRSGNPTRNVLEACLAGLDNGKYGMTFASGLGATTTICSLLSSGDHMLVTDDLYGGTSRLLRTVTARMGVTPEFIDACDLGLLERSIKNNTKMVWIETPTNPLMKVIDIEAVCKVAHEKAPGVSSCHYLKRFRG